MTKHRVILSGLGVLAALALTNPSLAQTASSSASGDAKSSATLDKAKMQEQAAKVSADSRAQTDAKLTAQAKKIDATASASGSATVATRMSKEFGVSADVLTSERQQFDVGWGQIMIAHTLMASATNGVTADQLLQLRQQGMGWGEIAAGLGLSLGRTVSAVNAESRVALGQAKGDGQVARIQGAGAQAHGSSTTEAHLPATNASVHAGLGLGLGHR